MKKLDHRIDNTNIEYLDAFRQSAIYRSAAQSITSTHKEIKTIK